MKVSIMQSNYLPWKGYFDLIKQSDLFIFYDDVQFTKNDWRNRNQIKTPKGLDWISIPCGIDLKRNICDVQIEDDSWQKSHWGKLLANYKKAPYFSLYEDFFKDFYLNKRWPSLSELNQYLIKHIAQNFLNISTPIGDSRSFDLEGRASDRVLDLLQKIGATEYLSGPNGKAYLKEDDFKAAGIQLSYMDYSQYKPYEQLFPPFTHNVSIVDLLLNCGKESFRYI